MPASGFLEKLSSLSFTDRIDYLKPYQDNFKLAHLVSLMSSLQREEYDIILQGANCVLGGHYALTVGGFTDGTVSFKQGELVKAIFEQFYYPGILYSCESLDGERKIEGIKDIELELATALFYSTIDHENIKKYDFLVSFSPFFVSNNAIYMDVVTLDGRQCKMKTSDLLNVYSA
ncbi:hypothetical protein D3C71_1172880 [compost metagenome]